MARHARQLSIDPTEIQVLHLWNRCVRRSYLCGHDPLTGNDYEYRRHWSRDRLEHLASIFAIDCLTFAIMSNHTHQILRSRPDLVATWEDREVVTRWLRITPKRDARGQPLEPTEAEINSLLSDPVEVTKLRLRLSDVSWWMRYFSHYIAVRANQEDELTGHFWEARFGSEVLETEASILTCMIYVDLNPIRAGMATTPEDSDYTGAKERIDDLRISLGTTDLGATKLTLQSTTLSTHDWERLNSQFNQCSGWLVPIEVDERCDPLGPDAEPGPRRASRKGAIAISFARYLELLEWVGQTLRSDKRGSIPAGLTPILSRLGLSSTELLCGMWQFGCPSQRSEVFPGIASTGRPRTSSFAGTQLE